MSVLLEVCVDSITSAKAAKEGGADRLEVCSALSAGGTTPSFGLVEQCVADLQMNVMMMIRPHEGGFAYTEDEMETMLTDIEVAKSIGVQGVVFGSLTIDRRVHVEQCRRLVEAAETMETTFHRAFDVAVDPFAAIHDIQDLGFSRVLTSGQQASALKGKSLIRELVSTADRTIILAGAGIDAGNVWQLVGETGVSEVHASASKAIGQCQSHGSISFGKQRRITSADKVRAIKAAISTQRTVAEE